MHYWLAPLALLYGLAVAIRNALYRVGLLRRTRFDLPVISVGNLTVGGTGKSPHIEYMVRWLDQYLSVGVLSRGYGRKTAGFRPVSAIDTAGEVGDEPLQFKRKFPNVPIGVSESRVLGVPELVRRNPDLQCVLLDDAFQHLPVEPGLNILLTEYDRPFTRDWLLPVGRLREWPAAYRRADHIIITKCPVDLSEEDRSKRIAEIDPYPRQQVFFSRYIYADPYDLLDHNKRRRLDRNDEVLLVSAIANTDYLMDYLGQTVHAARSLSFADHHFFDDGDLLTVLRRWEAMEAASNIILTTEKDATRLEPFLPFIREKALPFFVLPVQVTFDREDEAAFHHAVKAFLLGFRV